MAEMAIWIENKESPTSARKDEPEPCHAPGPGAVESGSEKAGKISGNVKDGRGSYRYEGGPPCPRVLFLGRFHTSRPNLLISNFTDDAFCRVLSHRRQYLPRKLERWPQGWSSRHI